MAERIGNDGVYGEGFPSNGCCKPALAVFIATRKEGNHTCDSCPFPFCIVSEARHVRLRGKAYLVASMLKLGESARQVARELGVSVRTVQRAGKSYYTCHWCSIDKYVAEVICRPQSCTVAFDGSAVVVVLPEHRRASDHEEKVISDFIESLFPDGVLRQPQENGSVHDHWVINNLLPGEAQSVYARVSELSKYTNKLR